MLIFAILSSSAVYDPTNRGTGRHWPARLRSAAARAEAVAHKGSSIDNAMSGTVAGFKRP